MNVALVFLIGLHFFFAGIFLTVSGFCGFAAYQAKIDSSQFLLSCIACVVTFVTGTIIGVRGLEQNLWSPLWKRSEPVFEREHENSIELPRYPDSIRAADGH